jgi:hypothetical protein
MFAHGRTVCCDGDHSTVRFMSALSQRTIPVESITVSSVRAMLADA